MALVETLNYYLFLKERTLLFVKYNSTESRIALICIDLPAFFMILFIHGKDRKFKKNY